MLRKNQIEQMQITAMSSDGNGIAKFDGMVVFVPYSAVGDELLVRIVKVQKHYSYGIIEQILKPSPDRVQDGCPVYQKCGGCAFRHISYQAELRHKAEFVESNLRRLGGLEPKMLPITPSPLVKEKSKQDFLQSEATGLSPVPAAICSRSFLRKFWNIPAAFCRSIRFRLMTSRAGRDWSATST